MPSTSMHTNSMQHPTSMFGAPHHMNGQYPPSQMQTQSRISPPPNDQEELIPTAIVIKNIPFAVKKEQLFQLMSDLKLPLPYAFNYHFDQGVFRGLAFANFTSADETTLVIDAMNHMELQGRKLRVEYKRMLPAAERDRIERDKREKRGQLEEQHRPIAVSGSLHNQSSMNSMASGNHATSPSPISMRAAGKLGTQNPPQLGVALSFNLTNCPDLDMNDPTTLAFFSKLLMFKNETDKESLVFPSTVSPSERRTIHTLAHNMGLEHRSEGTGDNRQVQILKTRPAPINTNTQQLSGPQLHHSWMNETRRALNRAATTDFSESRETSYYNHSLGRQGSGLLDIPGSPGLSGLSASHNLRAAKSFADLRSYTPSPVPSTASFPAHLSQNVSRYNEYSHSADSGTPNLTPTSAQAQSSQSRNEDSFLLNGISSMSIGYDRPSASRTTATGRLGQDRENHTSSAGPIGSQRPVNGNYDDNTRNSNNAVPERQPRGPTSDWGPGFSRPRQNGHVNRGSGELDLNSVEHGWDDNKTQDSSDRNGTGPSNSRYM